MGGTGGHGQLRTLCGGRLKEVAECRGERAVVDCAADLQQQGRHLGETIASAAISSCAD